MYRRYLVAAVAALTTTIGFAGAASAVPAGETYVKGTVNQLRTHSFNSDNQRSTCSSIVARNERVNGMDSPRDANTYDYVAHICPGDYIEVYTQKSLNLNTAVGNLTNVGFDFRTADITGAGQVYIALVLSNGDILFLDAAHCATPIPSSSTWSTADFSGTTAAGACTIYDTEGNAYTSDGTSSALDVYQAAHPGVTVDYDYLLVSAAPGEHDIHLDRIQLGTGYQYDYSKLYAHPCSSEAAC